MKQKDEKLAKEIFFRYAGSHYQMEREGEFERYKSLVVSDEQELVWLLEYQDSLLSKFKESKLADDFYVKLIGLIRRSKRDDSLLNLLSVFEANKKEFDTFTKVRISEDLCELIRAFDNNSRLMQSVKLLAQELLDLAKCEPILIASYYMELGHMKDILCEDFIVKRIGALRKRLSS